MQEERSYGAIIFSKKNNKIKFLLLHYESGHWDFVKGNTEKGEKPEETAKRELKEETGIDNAEFMPDFKEKIEYFYKRKIKGELVHKTVLFFLMKTNKTNVKLSFEHKGYKWLSYKDALEKVTYDTAKSVLKKANAFLTRKTIKDFM